MDKVNGTDKVKGLVLFTLSHLSIMTNEQDDDQRPSELQRILSEITPWGIQSKNVHRGTIHID